jgi:hypothetical protein
MLRCRKIAFRSIAMPGFVIEPARRFAYTGDALGMSMALAVPKLLAALPRKYCEPFQQTFGLGRRSASDAYESGQENGYVDW